MEKEISVEIREGIQSVYDIRRTVYSQLEEYVRQVLYEVETITFDKENEGENFCVGYNGGNHPEYASNMFSDVYSIFKRTYQLKDGTIETYYVLDLEDGETYIDELSFDDMVLLAKAIEIHLTTEHEKEDE